MGGNGLKEGQRRGRGKGERGFKRWDYGFGKE